MSNERQLYESYRQEIDKANKTLQKDIEYLERVYKESKKTLLISYRQDVLNAVKRYKKGLE